MSAKFKNAYELMDWAASRVDLDSEQRRRLYKIIEEKGLLERSKSPADEAPDRKADS